MKALLLLVLMAGTAWAVDRNCPPGQQWSISEGACVKKKPAPRLSPQEKYNQASEELQGKGDPKHAVQLLEEACTAKHGSSCTLLGFLYARGRAKVVRDDVKAMEFFVKGCSNDDLEGCFNIGDLGVRTAEYPAARVAFSRACQLGSGVGCARGADLIERGIGGPADATAARTMFEKALALLKCPEDGNACYVLGILHEGGKGTPKDPPRAVAAYKNGCNSGSGDACVRLAHVLDEGIGVAKDVDGANDALDKACTRYDNGDACQKIGERLGIAKTRLPHAFELAKRGCELDPKYCGTLAEFYRLGFGIAAADQAEATRYYKTACEAGGGWCDNYGRRAHDGVGMAADPAAAQAALERGCKGGWPASCYQGAQYLIAAKTDDARASVVANMGCDGKHGNSCYLAGWLASVGRAGGPASPERALALFERACELKSPVGCNAAGDAYRAGSGVMAADPTKAIERYETACTGNGDELFSGACKSWGMMLYFGEAGGVKDAPKALAAFTRGCKYGEPDTCGYLGTLVTETGGKLDPVLEVMEGSCKDGHEHACIALGNQLAASSKESDRRKGYDVFAASCGRKSDDGCLRQADLLADGWGITKDVTRAESIYRGRCDDGRPAACFGMGRLYEKQGHLDEALRMFMRACDGGWSDACSSVGFAYYTAHGVRWDVAAAAKYFMKACELGSSVGCANSGDVYRYGAGAPVDHKKAFELYGKACRPGDPTGCAGVGHYLATGQGGTKVDKTRAASALRSACENDLYVMPEACRALADLLDEQRGSPAEIARLRTTAFARAQELAKDNPYYMYVVGTYHDEGMATVRDPAQAITWLSKACDGFDPLGCIAAGKALRATKKPDDAERARVYFERACAAGVDEGCANTIRRPIGPAPVAHAKGCGCSGEVAPGGAAGLALVVLAIVVGRRRRSR